jgi:hypothetical protein
VPSKGGILFEGLRYNSAALANLRIAPGAPNKFRIKIDPENLGTILVHDFEHDRFVPVPVIASQKPFAEGVSLRMHQMARALIRNNPERYEGDDSQAQALVDIMRSTRAKMGKGTQKERRFHARHLFRDTTQAMEPTTAVPGDIVDPFADLELIPGAETDVPQAPITTPTVDGVPDAADGPAHGKDFLDFDAEAERLGIKPKK